MRAQGASVLPYFNPQHPLATRVRAMCTHLGRRRIGQMGCGPCWEKAIRMDAGQVEVPEFDDVEVFDVDPVVVQRILEGDWGTASNPAERREVCLAWLRQGRSLYSLGLITGWKPERYVWVAAERERVEREQAAEPAELDERERVAS